MGKKENVLAVVAIFLELGHQLARRVLDRVLDLDTVRTKVEGLRFDVDTHATDIHDAHEQIKRIRREKSDE